MEQTRDNYEPKAKTTSIKFASRASVKVGDSYYTVECCEERCLPDSGYNIELEREALWDVVNSECDKQIEQIIDTFRTR